MILGGRRVRANIPVVNSGDRYTFSEALNGNSRVILHTFIDFGVLAEVLVKVPVLADGSWIIVRLLDKEFCLDAGDARYESGMLGEGNTHVLEIAKSVHPGDVLTMIPNSAIANEVVNGVIYVKGM